MPRRQPQQSRHNAASNSRPSRSQRLDTMARKKDERAARKKERKASSNVVAADDKSFASQLAEMGLKVREVIGDGNCLFRALADQLDGDDHAHSRHRQDVVRYITEHRDDFEPFIEDDVPFTQHVQNLAQVQLLISNLKSNLLLRPGGGIVKCCNEYVSVCLCVCCMSTYIY